MYIKPEIKSYSTEDILEALGPSQSQYTTTTLYTTTGNSAVNVDGDVWSDGTVTDTSAVWTGDDTDNAYARGLFGFDISSLSGRTIVSATLRIYQSDTPTGTPYTSLGSIVVDHVNFGSSMDVSDFLAEAITSNIGTISNNTTLEWKTLDVASYVQADINAGRTSSQYMTRFTTNTDSDSGQDMAFFEDAENSDGTGNRPQLVITYR